MAITTENTKDFAEGDIIEVASKLWNGRNILLALILKKRSEEGFNYQAYDILDITTGEKHYVHMFHNVARRISISEDEIPLESDTTEEDWEYGDYDYYDDWLSEPWQDWQENLELDDHRR